MATTQIQNDRADGAAHDVHDRSVPAQATASVKEDVEVARDQGTIRADIERERRELGDERGASRRRTIAIGAAAIALAVVLARRRRR
jgi:hypothetical protein